MPNIRKEKLDALIQAGSLMSNWFYNVSQCPEFKGVQYKAEWLRNMCDDWDKAKLALTTPAKKEK